MRLRQVCEDQELQLADARRQPSPHEIKLKRCVALNDLVLPQHLREEFRKPFGKIVSLDELKVPAGKKLITVGDKASFSIISAGFKPDIIVFDKLENRKPVSSDVKNCLQNYAGKKFVVKNPAGRITAELWAAIKLALESNSPVAIEVDGEEDLAAFPFFLESPAGTAVLYGLFDKGMVDVKVDKKLKDKCKKLLKEMTEGL